MPVGCLLADLIMGQRGMLDPFDSSDAQYLALSSLWRAPLPMLACHPTVVVRGASIANTRRDRAGFRGSVPDRCGTRCQANRLTHHLSLRGIGAEDLVVLALPRSQRMLSNCDK